MSGRIYKKHEKRRLISKRYAEIDPAFFGAPHCDEYYIWRAYYEGRQWRWYKDEFDKIEHLTWWDIEELDLKEKESYYVRHLDRSRWRGYGKKGYKKKYHAKRRVESKLLEYAAMIDDEEGFDKIAPDGWKGCIGWEIW